MLTPSQRRDLNKAIRHMERNRKPMGNKKSYRNGERIVHLPTGRHGWVRSWHANKFGATLFDVVLDRPLPNGDIGSNGNPWSLLRPETFMEYLFARKWSFGKWTLWQAVVIYGFLSIVAYGGVKTITYFGQLYAGVGLLAFVVVMVAGSIRLHWENFKGRQA